MQQDGASADPGDVRIRLLDADEAHRLVDLIRATYRENYDVSWVYDAGLVARRISQGLFVSCVAETDQDEIVSHLALSLRTRHDPVGHTGQGLTVPAARGQHRFEAVARQLDRIAVERGLVGLYSEATTAHPYSQRASVARGGKEVGFLLGWIPSTVSNDAAVVAVDRRQSAALMYRRIRAMTARPAYAPQRHRDIVHRTITVCGLHARMADVPRHVRLPKESAVQTRVLKDHNVAILTVTQPGTDLARAVDAIRRRLFDQGIAVVYVDLPLDLPGTGLLADELEALGHAYAGIYPNTRSHGDVIRLQALHGLRISAADVAVATEHGRSLLEYILADLEATGHERPVSGSE